jgi:hypothetical protein
MIPPEHFEVAMRTKAGIIGTGLLGVALSAHAYTSLYSSMAVPGDHNSWNTAPSMVLAADNVWVCTQTLSSANGLFKFAANNGWSINWGGGASLARVPAVAAAPVSGGGNLAYAGFSNGLYRFTFNDSTKAFRLEWAGAAPLPIPVITNLALVGDFNSWTPSGGSLFTNHPSNTNLWSGTVTLDNTTAFQFRPNGNLDGQWGAPEAATLAMPVTNGNACGKSSFYLSGFAPGTFVFTLNVSNAAFTISQTSTQSFTAMTVLGNFIATTNLPPNMMRVGGTTQWASDHHITNSGTVTIRFTADNNTKRWGATNATPLALPAAGTLTTGVTSFANISGIVPGRYRIIFDHVTGFFSFRQVYTDSSGFNLLKNPGFEQTTLADGGDAVHWGPSQAWPKRAADGYPPHSGSWCGAVHGKDYHPNDYGSFSQDVLVEEGKNYRASAWFMGFGGWTAETMQVKIEWLDAGGTNLGDSVITDIPALTTSWVKYSAEGVAPSGVVTAHVVFLCSGAVTSGKMLVDDAEVRAVAERTQNFDTWGELVFFDDFAPDWSVDNGKTVWNVAPGRPPASVFISQYVEGTGNNKAIEIFNGTLSNLDLSAENFVLQQYDNGSLTASVTMALSGVVPPGTCRVVGRPNFPTNYGPDAAILGLPNLSTNKNLDFNGDDVVVLRRGGAAGTVMDRVGQVGTNATGSIWSRNTQNRTLTRKQTIFTGTTTAATAPFPLKDEWDSSASDTFAGLGTHEISFLDPNEPYTPAGYSLVMNSGAMLMSGELNGGIGDVSFWCRTESPTPAVTLVLESGPSDAGPWTTNATLSGITLSNFTYYVIAVNRADHLYVRWRQTDGGTNRFRIDEITVTAPSAVKRFEDFSGWTDPAFAVPGNYSRYGWSLQGATIAPTSGVSGSRAALISPPSSSVSSPVYESGVGEMIFWAKTYDSLARAYLLLQTTIDGGSNWTTQAAFTVTNPATFTTWLYLTNFAQVRIVFDPAQNSGDALVDNIEVRVPVLYRNQNFDAWPYKSSYSSGVSFNQGWSISNCKVNAEYSYAGMSAYLTNSVNGTARIQGPYLPDGIGSISYRLRKTSDSATSPTMQVQVSPNGVGWTAIATNTAISTNYEQFVLFREDATNHFVRFVHTAGASFVPVDDIRIGTPQPRPEVSISPGIDPPSPDTNQTVQLTADIVTRYGAGIVSVTGYYRIAAGPTNALPMAATAFGSYASASSIPVQAAGTQVLYWVQAWYSGIGAAPASTGFSTNLVTSATNLYQVSSVRKGDVWINEIAYLAYFDEFFEQDHEFVELCGVAGTSISNWTIQLALGDDLDIAANSNQPVYASYKITGGHTFTNQTNGFSFYVLGDSQLSSNHPVNKFLTTLVPPVDENWGFDHIKDNRGVVRLLNEYSNLVYSLSYAGYASGSENIPVKQGSADTNSVGLGGSGSYYEQFGTWDLTNFTIGAVNDGQTLVPAGTTVSAAVWHIPSLFVTPLNTNDLDPFYMRDPLAAQNQDPLLIHYGYSTTNYSLPDGTLHHCQKDFGWSTLAMNIRQGSADANSNAYVAATIPLRTYPRGSTIEYVIQANPNKAGVSPVYIGQGATTNDYVLFETLDAAKASPFTYTYAIRSSIYITNMTTNATQWILHTVGNDTLEPFTNFVVYGTTNILTRLRHIYDASTNIVGYGTNDTWGVWVTNRFTNTRIDAFGQNVFYVTKTNRPVFFYRIDLRWP